MILKRTVLIVGAGGSHPYGYPLGGQLVDRIVDLTDIDNGGGLVRDIHASFAGLRGFHHRLKESDVRSIDDFLESNPGFAEIGKLSIAAALTVWGPIPESHAKPKGDWYRYLWGRLHERARDPEEFCLNRLRIVTYNYDRSLERYFGRVLRNAYPDLSLKDDPAIAQFVAEAIPTVHLHGSLGPAEDTVLQASNREAFRSLPFYREVAAGIRIVHEDESAEYSVAHKWLREAEAIYFLGFGYHPTNVERLNLAGLASRSVWKRCKGTAYEMEAAERARALIALKLDQEVLHPVDCLTFLRSIALLD